MPTTAPTPAPAFDVPNEIQVKWTAEGGATGPIGQPIAAATMASSYCSQSFEGGFIAASIFSDGRLHAFVVRKNSGSTGPQWYSINGSAATIPASDEQAATGGSYQRFVAVAPALLQYIFAPTGGSPFEVGYADLATHTPDQTLTAISAAQRFFSGYPNPFGAVPLFSQAGIPDRPASCTLTRGGCEVFFGGGAWRFLSVTGGPTGIYQPGNAIGAAYNAQGAEAGPLGYPTSGQFCSGTDCRVSFENADLSQYQGVAHLIQDPFRYVSRAIATTDAVCGLAGGRCRQEFTDATAYKLANGSVVTVNGDFRTRWVAFGGEAGLGFPLANVQGSTATYQQFERGTLAHDPYGSLFVIYAGISANYLAAGTPSLGAPVGDQYCTGPGGGCYQWFQQGIIWWSPATGAHTVRNDQFVPKYQQFNWAWGGIGYPTGDPQCLRGRPCSQSFQGGTLWFSQNWYPDVSASQPVYVLHGAIGAKYASLNSASGPLMFPSSDEQCSPSGYVCRQDFLYGTVWWSPGTGAHPLNSLSFLPIWEEDGRVTGLPVEDEQCTGPNGSCHQTFENGLYWRSSVNGLYRNGAYFVRAGMLAAYASMSWAWGPLGVPTGNEYQIPNASRQDFEHGSIIWRGDGTFYIVWR